MMKASFRHLTPGTKVTRGNEEFPVESVITAAITLHEGRDVNNDVWLVTLEGQTGTHFVTTRMVNRTDRVEFVVINMEEVVAMRNSMKKALHSVEDILIYAVNPWLAPKR